MARTSEQIQADIDAVLAEAGSGENTIRHSDGSEIVMRPESERRAALAALRQELASVQAAANSPVRRRTYLFTGEPGY